MDLLISKQLGDKNELATFGNSYENIAKGIQITDLDIESNKNKHHTSDTIQCSSNPNRNETGRSGIHLRNLSRGYSEGDGLLILDAAVLLDSSERIDKFKKESILRNISCDLSYENEVFLSQKDLKVIQR